MRLRSEIFLKNYLFKLLCSTFAILVIFFMLRNAYGQIAEDPMAKIKHSLKNKYTPGSSIYGLIVILPANLRIKEIGNSPRPDHFYSPIDSNKFFTGENFKNLETLVVKVVEDDSIKKYRANAFIKGLQNFDGTLIISHRNVQSICLDTFKFTLPKAIHDTIQQVYTPRSLNFFDNQKFFNWPLVGSTMATIGSAIWCFSANKRMDESWGDLVQSNNPNSYVNALREYERARTQCHIAKVMTITSGSIMVLALIRNLFFRKANVINNRMNPSNASGNKQLLYAHVYPKLDINPYWNHYGVRLSIYF